MKNNTLQLLIKVFSEVTSIVVAVLFALWANSWWAERERTIEVDILTKEIVSELQENLSRLVKSHEHHTAQLKLIIDFKNDHDALNEEAYKKLNQKLFSKGVYQPAEIFFTYWEILTDKGLISEISNTHLSAIKPAYKSIEHYQKNWESIANSQIMISLLTKSEQERLEITNQTIAQLWWSEKNAINQIKQSLVQLGANVSNESKL
ncbi:MAG: hypothetical protein P8I03_10655 [Thalassotalea sp.]|nr:hypothetical protein [Thalassotalea sp.]